MYFIRRTRDKVHLTFAALCIVQMGYFIIQGLWYSTTDIQQALILVRFAYAFISLAIGLQLWFFYLFCEKPFPIFWCYLGTVIFSAFSIISFLPIEVALSLNGAITKTVSFLGPPDISIYDFQPGWILELFLFCAYTEMIILQVIICRYYLKQRGTLLKPMPIVWMIVLMTALYDSFVVSGVYDTIYLSEFAYILLVLTMAYRLTSNSIDAMDEVERLNVHLDHLVMERTHELEEKNKELEILSTTDQLTGIHNRRHAESLLYRQFQHSERYNVPLSVILVDLDWFKNINDTYGHNEGDCVLVSIARSVQQCIRNTDMAARWGGEEFLILAPETDMETCEALAQRLRKEIADQSFELCPQITASFGITEYRQGDTINTLLKRADTALYQAKEQGRNRVISN